MDELKLRLSTKFMKGMIAKFISKAIFKKVGVNPDIQLNEIEVEMKDGKMRIHISMDGEIDEKSLVKALQLVDLD